MKILHIATTYPLYPGDSNAAFVESISEGLVARGHECHVLLPWHPRLVLERPGRRSVLHAFRYTPLRSWHPWGYAQALTADRSLRPDTYLALPLAAGATVLKARRLLRRGFDVVHAHWLLPSGPLGALAAGRRVPLVISCHGSGVYVAERHAWAGRAAAWAGSRAAAMTACSRDLARRAQPFSGSEVEWLPYGVDARRFRPAGDRRDELRRELAARHGLPAADPWVLAVGRLVVKKGFDRLVAAVPGIRRHVPRARVVIVGSGPLRDDLARKAAELGVPDAVHLVGAASHDDMPNYYAAADLVVVPSIHGPEGNVDGLPNAFMEAMASGTAVVASRVAGIPDIARDGVTAALVPEGDVDALGETLAGLLRDTRRRAALGRAARADVESRLGWEEIAGRFEAVYERALGRGGRRAPDGTGARNPDGSEPGASGSSGTG